MTPTVPLLAALCVSAENTVHERSLQPLRPQEDGRKWRRGIMTWGHHATQTGRLPCSGLSLFPFSRQTPRFSGQEHFTESNHGESQTDTTAAGLDSSKRQGCGGWARSRDSPGIKGTERCDRPSPHMTAIRVWCKHFTRCKVRVPGRAQSVERPTLGLTVLSSGPTKNNVM